MLPFCLRKNCVLKNIFFLHIENVTKIDEREKKKNPERFKAGA